MSRNTLGLTSEIGEKFPDLMKRRKKGRQSFSSHDKRGADIFSPRKVDYLILAVFIVFLGLLIWTSFSYLGAPCFVDHFEAHVACVADLLWAGQPVYHDLESPDRYSTIMGPNTYLWSALLQGPDPRTIPHAKMPGVLTCWMGLVLLGILVWRKFDMFRAFLACGTLALIGLGFENFMYWNRGDPFLLFLLVIGAIGAMTRRITLGAILFGAAIGLAFGTKFHAVIYFIPFLPYFNRKVLSWKPLALGAGAAAGTVVLPFLFPQVSLSNYLVFLKTIREGPAIGQDLFWMISMLAVLSLPPVGLALASSERRWIRLFCWFVPVSFLIAMAAMYGLERHHALPLAVAVAVIMAEWMTYRRTKLTYGILVLFLVIAGFFSVDQWTVARQRINQTATFHNVEKDFESVMDSTTGLSRAVGYAGLYTYRFSQVRVLLLFREGSLLYLDAPALMDHRKAGLLLPSATIDAIRDKRIDLWLIPRGGEPWSIAHYYREDWALFSEEFKQAFFENYQLVGQSAFFNLWLAKGKQLPEK